MGKTAATQGNGVRARNAAWNPAQARLGMLPPDVRRILIVGAGGFGREALLWAQETWPGLAEKFAGFLSAKSDVLDGHDCMLPILGDPAEFSPAAGDAFVLAIGIPTVRRRVAEMLEARGAQFTSLVHPTAVIAPTARIGRGAVVCPFAIVSDAATIEPFTLLNFHSSLGHDAIVGEFGVLSPYATLGGGARLGADGFMGLHSSVGPGCQIGVRSKISANSCALSDAPNDSLIFGSPGRVSPLLRIGPS